MELERASPASVYETWDECYVSSDKGKREVHYYLKRKDGTGSDLAVIGKEKTLRHMSYHFAFKERSLLFNFANSSSFLAKLRSRREVVDWLNSIIHLDLQPKLTKPAAICPERKDDTPTYLTNLRNVQNHKFGQEPKEVNWLGSPWTCRKRRRHYQSFSRNGVEISVHDFVYVLAEEDERLVAHLDDMYEDSKGNKMVVVQWFHKLDEVGTVLPRNYNDREIFSSLCLQDLSIECIDGLATVLSPQHYEKFVNEAKYTQLEPFMCHRQFDNDEVKPLDITQVKGYWKQDALRYMFYSSPKSQLPDDSSKVEENPSDVNRPKKRLRRSHEGDIQKAGVDASLEDCIGHSSGKCSTGSQKEGFTTASVGKTTMEQQFMQCLSIGSEVEVLSHDSGLRGCWFRALIVKRHNKKVKVRYQDIKDVTDETKNLEEWVLASRLAAPDALGIRISGRTIVRPAPGSTKGKVSWAFNIGTLVDVWWDDGWWEGIIVKNDSRDQLHVYFPGEKQQLIFGCSDLRHSQEWLENGWKQLKERPDIVSTLYEVEVKRDAVVHTEVKPDKEASHRRKEHSENPKLDSRDRKLETLKVVRDLSKDDLLSKLRWKSSRRRRGRSPVHKVHFGVNERGHSQVDQTQNYQKFFVCSSLKKMDPDNCKYISGSPFSSSVVSPFSNLVMSR